VLLTITYAGPHAPDLGFLLHKHPDSVSDRDLAFGTLTVFYPENGPERATVALVLDLDPIALMRGARGAAGLDQYINDRPYVASSRTSVALREAFSTALAGRSKERPDLVDRPLLLRARLPAVRARGGPEKVGRLFAPLGYEIFVARPSLAPAALASDESDVVSVEIAGEQTVHDLLSHLYVLLPVLDAGKHYVVGPAEVEKLLAHGADWLPRHPERERASRSIRGCEASYRLSAIGYRLMTFDSRLAVSPSCHLAVCYPSLRIAGAMSAIFVRCPRNGGQGWRARPAARHP
jgi:3' terminal RNA ribose 2'-O-methyltransferase Hen1